MIYNNDLLKKIPLVDTENRKKYILPLHYGKVTNTHTSFWEALYRGLSDYKNNLSDYKNSEEENFIIIDSLHFKT